MANCTNKKLPAFVCVGGAKCGTTSLYEYLRKHPQVFLPDQKELHYFTYEDLRQRPNGPGMRAVLRGLIKTQEQYRAQYNPMLDDQIGGDISPSYLNEENAPARIKNLLGADTKIIILLRNPVDRIISHYMHLRRAAREDLTLEAALAHEPARIRQDWGDMWHYRASAYAADRVQRYFDHFGRDNVLVVLNEDLKHKPQESLSAICRFIGVNDQHRFDATKEFNRSGLPRSKWIARMVDASPIANMAKAILPRRFGSMIKRKLQEMNTGQKPDISPQLRAQLTAEFAPEVAQIQAILGRDTQW